MALAKRRSDSARIRLRNASDVLSDVSALRVKLESGEIVECNLAKECEIPRDPEELWKVGQKTPAQVAFWAYQTEIALDRVRGAETRLEKEEGMQFLVWRAFYEKEENETPTMPTLRARLDSDPKCRPFRVALRGRRKEYGQLRAVRDAVQRRDSMVRTLIGKTEPT